MLNSYQNLNTSLMRNVESTFLYKWFDEVWNKSDENAIDRLMTHDSEAHGILDDGPKGAAGFKIFFDNFNNIFHNIHIEVEAVVSEDDMESARTTVNAIDAQSNKPIQFSGMCMVRIADGKIAEAWNYYNFPTLDQKKE